MMDRTPQNKPITTSPDLVLTMIGACLAEGCDVREAILEVGLERVIQAFKDAPASSDTAGRLLALLAVKERMDQDDADMEQALELSAAGWTSYDPRAIYAPDLPPPKTVWEKTAVMSWYWRAPSKRPGKPGRRYPSTNQAWRAMKREKGEL